MKRTLIFAAFALLAGCSGSPNWVKDGASPPQTAQAISDCESQGREATRRDTNIMNDIMATRGGDWQRSGVKETQVQMFTASNEPRFEDVVNRCMAAKGYIPAR